MLVFSLFLIALLFIILIDEKSETKVTLTFIILLISAFTHDLGDEPVSFWIYLLCAVVAFFIFVGIEGERERKAKEKAKRDSHRKYADAKQMYYSVNKDDPQENEKSKQIQENAELSVEFLKRENNFTGTIQRIKWNKDFARNMETVNGLLPNSILSMEL